MNREIKFRAWFKREKRMIYSPMAISGGVGNDGWVLITAWVEGMDCNKAIYGRPEFEIMQFTGLKDKHGKEIYEGDIVHNVTYTFNGVVFFDNGSFWVREYLSHVDEGLYDDREKETRWSINLNWEVIGNLYEHPELLKEVAA